MFKERWSARTLPSIRRATPTSSENRRDFLRQQEIHVERLISDLLLPKDFGLFNFLVANQTKSFSRNLSDLVALYFLGSNNTFLELGAGDPVVGSDTYMLENSEGWTGVQVEPHPEQCNNLRSVRTKSIQVNAGIVADGERQNFYLDLKTMSLADKRKHDSIFVKSMDLSDLVEHTGISSFDALFIDIEGGELDIISSKIFANLNFRFINIERIWNGVFIENRLKSIGYSQVGSSFSSYSGWFIKDL
jgi:FkbM family methyltransferase